MVMNKFNPCKVCVRRRKSPDFFYPYSTSSETSDSDGQKEVNDRRLGFALKSNSSSVMKKKKGKIINYSIGRKFSKAFRRLHDKLAGDKPKQYSGTLISGIYDRDYRVCNECNTLEKYPENWLPYYYYIPGE